MKQIKNSDTTARPDVESSASSERVRTNYRMTALRGKILKGTLTVLSVALFITIYVLANKNGHTHGEESEYISAVNSRSLEVEVLDGAGSMRAAQQLTNILRAQGYDVVEMKKNNGEIEERTFLFDRSGNLDATRKLATVLGVPQDKVFQKIDRTLYLDITVVLGKDYPRLTAFQSPNERNKH
jgi:hypothetical protein